MISYSGGTPIGTEQQQQQMRDQLEQMLPMMLSQMVSSRGRPVRPVTTLPSENHLKLLAAAGVAQSGGATVLVYSVMSPRSQHLFDLSVLVDSSEAIALWDDVFMRATLTTN